MHYPQDTIAAIATAPGIGAIGVIRLSGNDAVLIANKIFKGRDLTQQATHTIHFGHIIDPSTNELIDEVVVSLFLGSKSYTGENTVEISGHGSPYILQRILEVAIANGARMATHGEFTQRAFLNGKLDLAQAEAVADLIAADSKAAQQAALKQLRGGFSNDLKHLRDQLIQFAALIELELDFSEEDVEFADRTQFKALIQQIKSASQQLIDSFQLGNAIKKGVSVAIIGKPNAGKSTLLNAFLNEERAIVSDIAGTTRDTIEETLNINGIIFRLIDTAGIRTETADAIEEIGVGKSLEKMREADVVIYLFDVNTTTKTDLEAQEQLFKQENLQYLFVANKIDTLGFNAAQVKYKGITPILFISAKEKIAVEEVKQALFDAVIDGSIQSENTIVTNARHHASLLNVVNSLNEVQDGMDMGLSGELLAIDIRRSLHFLGEITGQVEIDRDILGTIFGKFCIGK
jgi:tRNA modification GTPase